MIYFTAGFVIEIQGIYAYLNTLTQHNILQKMQHNARLWHMQTHAFPRA